MLLVCLASLGLLAGVSSALVECEKNIDPYTAECDGKPYSLYDLRGADSPSAHPYN